MQTISVIFRQLASFGNLIENPELLVLLLLSFATGNPKVVGANPEVTIAQGTLKGISLETDGKAFDRFLAIPYGEPPIGDLR